jgi:hypothetical protein
MEVSEAMAYKIMGILGGMTIPMVEEAAVTAALTFLGYFFLIISGIRILPIEAVSATEEPEIPPKTILAKMLTCPKAPWRLPSKMVAKSRILLVMPPSRIKTPANTKKGMAVSKKESAPEIMRRVAMDEGRSWIKTPKVVLIKMEKPIGQPITNKMAIMRRVMVNTNAALTLGLPPH